jgi:OOP family OmpA-OmpF porin
MPSRYLVLILFALWSVICWRWYVCVIKVQCGPEPALAAVQPQDSGLEYTETPANGTTFPENTSGETSPPAPPALDAPASPSLPAPTQSVSSQPANLDRVQIVSQGDKIQIYFPYNSTRREDNDAIDEYLTRLAQNLSASGGTITITGHTDMVGDAKANKTMGLQRAQHIRDILIAKGARKEQIICRSLGESKPIATNDTPQGRYQNRRVEIE